MRTTIYIGANTPIVIEGLRIIAESPEVDQRRREERQDQVTVFVGILIGIALVLPFVG